MAYKLGIIGAGKIGEALVQGVLSRGLAAPADLILSVKSDKHRAELEARTGIRTVLDNREIAAQADTLVVAVKPKGVAAVLEGVADLLGPSKLVISTAAGVPSSSSSPRSRRAPPSSAPCPTWPSRSARA